MKRLFVFLTGLVSLGWIGLKMKPKPFSKYPQTAPELETVQLPENLPPPVRAFYEAIVGDQIPLICSAVITGQGKLKLGKISFNGRLRFTHRAGYDYRHYIDLTWFGKPFVKVNEHYREGKSYMELPSNTFEDIPELNSAANLAVWGEALWFPTIFVTDERVRWEAIDDQSARLIVPYEHSDNEPEQEFIVTFDPKTHLIQRMETMRYREPNQPRIGWVLEALEWRKWQGMMIPSVASVTWADQDFAWLTVEVEDVVYNADVSKYIRARGL